MENATALRIMEWNVHHQGCHSGFYTNEYVDRVNEDYFDWVNKVICGKKADIVILTEFCKDTQKLQAELGGNYEIYKSENKRVNNVAIAANTKKIRILDCLWECADKSEEIPENLLLRCQAIENGKEFIVCGVRIKELNNDDNKYCYRNLQMLNLLHNICNNFEASIPTIIGGDFNNNRRKCPEQRKEWKLWNLGVIDKFLRLSAFERKTPDGSSWARDVDTANDYCFAEDHFLVSGIEIVPDTLKYDRKFAENDKKTYGEEPYDFSKIPVLFPDHAILEAEIKI